jgi:murein L,D-transpeptidase YafK
MPQLFAFSIRPVLVVLLSATIALICCYYFGRSLWHPLMIKIIGGTSIADRIAMIVQKRPELLNLKVTSLTLFAIKDPGYVDVFINDKKWQRFPFTARSGIQGPKLKEGDGQIPEGFYDIVTLNPNSSYHLSLKISYPNDDDKKRSDKLGISNYGSDIYMHGKNASIGCIAIGDEAIEQVFYLVHQAGLDQVSLAIVPVDLLTQQVDDPTHQELYFRLKKMMARYY